MTSIRVNMVPAYKNGYGHVAQSQEAFRPTGNRSDWNNFVYRYGINQFEQITLPNGDTYGEDALVLCAIPTVISLYKTGTEKTDGGSIAIGDEIIVNDVTYVVTAKRYEEPILVRK